jgi:hypothetical protein
MSDFTNYAPNDIDATAVIGDPTKGWLRPYCGTGKGMEPQVEVARAAWVDLKAGVAEAQAKAHSILSNDELSDVGRQRNLDRAAKDFSTRFSEVERRLSVLKMEIVNTEIHLEKQGRPVPEETDAWGLHVWKELSDVGPLEIETLYLDYIEAEPKSPDAAKISGVMEQMLDIKTGRRRLSDDVIAEGRRRRGELKDPQRAAILATLRSAHDHLTWAHRSAVGHVGEMFAQPKRDAIAEAARGFNGH